MNTKNKGVGFIHETFGEKFRITFKSGLVVEQFAFEMWQAIFYARNSYHHTGAVIKCELVEETN